MSGTQGVVKDNPGVYGIAQKAQQKPVDICRAVFEGTLFLRENKAYLPQWEKEEDDAYSERLASAVLFNAYKKTITSLTGIVYREPPTLGEDIPQEILPHLENIDLSGQHLDLFAQNEFEDKMIDGHTHIIVDWSGPEGARSLAEEMVFEARPYWTEVQKGQVRRHWVRQAGGATVPISWAYAEEVLVKDGAFSQKQITRLRQFDLVDTAGEFLDDEDFPLPLPKDRRVLFRSWRQEQEGGEWIPEITEEIGEVDPNSIPAGSRIIVLENDDGSKQTVIEGKTLGDKMTKIPVVTDYVSRKGFMQSDPPFLDLALENLKHFQIRSERDQNLHVTSIPILNVYGIKAEELRSVTVGTAMGLAFPKGKTEQGSEYTEARGFGLEHTQQELQDIQARMAALGTSMLERQVRVAETEKSKMLDQKAQDSELAANSRRSSDAFNECLELHAMWMGLPSGGTLTVNTDFSTDQMSPELFDKYITAVKEGIMTLETFWNRLESGKLLPAGFDQKRERDALEKEGIAELEAAAEIARQQQVEEELDDEGV